MQLDEPHKRSMNVEIFLGARNGNVRCLSRHSASRAAFERSGAGVLASNRVRLVDDLALESLAGVHQEGRLADTRRVICDGCCRLKMANRALQGPGEVENCSRVQAAAAEVRTHVCEQAGSGLPKSTS